MAFVSTPPLTRLLGRTTFCTSPTFLSPITTTTPTSPSTRTPTITPTTAPTVTTITFPSDCPAPSTPTIRPFRNIRITTPFSAPSSRSASTTTPTSMSADGPSSSSSPSSPQMTSKVPTDRDPKTVTDAEWRKLLSPEEYRILREKGTEYPGTGEYDGFYPKEGHFVCAACGNPIYSAASKFKSGCGWPAFDKCYRDSISIKVDRSFGMNRVEIMCAKCDGHLGHVFEGERMTKTNERHCVNSVSVKYVDGPVDLEEDKLM